MYQPRPHKNTVRRLVLFIILPFAAAYFTVPRINFTGEKPGTVIDSLDGVYVYNNGSVSATYGRNLSPDGYNIGMKYQCVEFVKRYYLYHYGHRMPGSYGHARDFFDKTFGDGQYNASRGLVQYSNPSSVPPQKGDLVVFAPTASNSYGHVAIISRVDENRVEIIQQNSGKKNGSRRTMNLERVDGLFHIGEKRVRGWLRIKEENNMKNR